MKRILALDVGGTSIKSAIFENDEIKVRLPQEPSCSGGMDAGEYRLMIFEK